jgi:hypothetical protein
MEIDDSFLLKEMNNLKTAAHILRRSVQDIIVQCAVAQIRIDSAEEMKRGVSRVLGTIERIDAYKKEKRYGTHRKRTT